MCKRKTTEQFVKEAIAIHGNKYDYSFVNYSNQRTKVKIVCDIHGYFYQTPSAHLRGCGCSLCGNIKRNNSNKMLMNEFLLKAKDKHGDTYDYSETLLGNTLKEKVTIICKKHGRFTQFPRDHLNGCGCRECYNEKQRTTKEDFISRANEKHNYFYSYDKVNLKSTANKVIITCPIHGDFEQEAAGHLYGYGCMRCFSDSLRMPEEDFIQKAKQIHGDSIDYSLVKYESMVKNVTLICPTHGEFSKQPQLHLYGQGCPSCSHYGFNPSKIASVYLLESENLIKIGITNRKVTERLRCINNSSPEIFNIVYYVQINGELARRVEEIALEKLKLTQSQPTRKFDGYTECFYKNGISIRELILYLDSIIEDEECCGY